MCSQLCFHVVAAGPEKNRPARISASRGVALNSKEFQSQWKNRRFPAPRLKNSSCHPPPPRDESAIGAALAPISGWRSASALFFFRAMRHLSRAFVDDDAIEPALKTSRSAPLARADPPQRPTKCCRRETPRLLTRARADVIRTARTGEPSSPCRSARPPHERTSR